MQMNVQTSAGQPRGPLYQARQKTAAVREQLEVASAELGLTNTVLGHNLPHNVRSIEVQRALSQNVAIEETVQEAANELQVVTELLQEEVVERKRLEKELASRPPN